MTANILVFGCGNPSRGDDALGPLLLEELERRLDATTRAAAGGIELLTDFQLQVEHALDLVGRTLVLFADAHLACPPPYFLECLCEADQPAYTTHALSPAAVLKIYRQIQGSAPPACFQLGIRGERFELGESLTAGARTHLEAAVELALDLCVHPDPEYWQNQRRTEPASAATPPPASLAIDRFELPHRGPAGPAIRLADLIPEAGTNAVRFVGIDLTGSAARPTGWCLLDGNQVTTRCLRTDEELIAAALETHPHVVSIDSPLSLPSGRTSVSDDDPGRQEFGIMRHCERTLKKRSINVYPALIPSMQKLTARGIRLASEFRSRGIPVIESYPGAAQDIMGIPRKRASLEMLRDGLKEFGVTGEFLERQVTHDELDAITAAIVGAFFWGGRFETLGAEDEEALIIPDLARQPQTWLQRQVIGLSGPLAAGKTTAARHLESLGFRYARYSMVLEKVLAGEGEKPTRSKLQEFGAEIHQRYGQRWLGRRLLESLPEEGNLVIDGLRFPDDHSFLIERFGPAFLHIYVAAPEDIRQARFAEREVGNPSFAKSEVHPVKSRVQELRALAHVEITNDVPLHQFQGEVAALSLPHQPLHPEPALPGGHERLPQPR